MSIYKAAFDSIYEALDNEKYDLALQLCLKPEIQLITLGKSLLAYTYAMKRSNVKSLEIAKTIIEAQPFDEPVVNTLGCALKIIRADKELAELYENAMKKKTFEDSFVIDLFSCYCRQLDPKNMQYVAQRLYKSHPDKVYYLYWSITCMLLQNLPTSMLVLTEKMCYKLHYELKTLHQPATDEMILYAYTLIKQEKYLEALKAMIELKNRAPAPLLKDDEHYIENSNLVTMHNLQYSTLKLDLLIRIGLYPAVVDECKIILIDYPDQWNVHKVLIDCIFILTLEHNYYNNNYNNNGNNDNRNSNEDQLDMNTLAKDDENSLLQFPVQDLSLLLKHSVLSKQQQVIIMKSKSIHKNEPLLLQHNDSLNRSNSSNSTNNNEITLSKLSEHLSYLRELQQKHPIIRGPFLAEIYLFTNAITTTATTSSDSCSIPIRNNTELQYLQEKCDFFDETLFEDNTRMRALFELTLLIAQYLKRFQSKYITFSDIKEYIRKLYDLQLQYMNEFKNEVEVVAIDPMIDKLQRWVKKQQDLVAIQLEQALINALHTSNNANSAHNTIIDDVTANTDNRVVGMNIIDSLDDNITGDDDYNNTTNNKNTNDNTNTITTSEDPTSEDPNNTTITNKSTKKNKKKKNKKKASVLDTEGITKDTLVNKVSKIKETVEANNDILLLLCAYCKFDQVISFCNYLKDYLPIPKRFITNATSDSFRTIAEVRLSHRLVMYSYTRLIFQQGVGGEVRNIQPGDELLLENSSYYRQQYRKLMTMMIASQTEHNDTITVHNNATSTTSSTSTTNNTSMMNTTTAVSNNHLWHSILQWYECLVVGVEASPYSHAFKMDLMEACRVLGLGKVIYTLFKSLGIKYIQNDSMSYLVLPSLMEAGLFREASFQNSQVIFFHKNARRDTLDMISKAFQYSNYMKAIELHRFVEHCARSTQLIASKVEYAYLEISLKHLTPNNALQYLSELMQNKLNESQSLLDNEELKGLIDRMDYNILIRSDMVYNDILLAKEHSLYRFQIENRIGYSQYCLRLLYHALQMNIIEANGHFEETVKYMKACIIHTGIKNEEEEAINYFQWDQSISLKDTIFNTISSRDQAMNSNNIILETFTKTIKYCLLTIATNTNSLKSVNTSSSSSSSGSSVAVGFANISELVKSLKDSLFSLYELRYLLLKDDISSIYIAIDIENSSSSSNNDDDDDDVIANRCMIISPVWLKTIAYYQHTIGVCLPLLMQTCFNKCGKSTTTSFVTTQEKLSSMNDCEEYLENIASAKDTLSSIEYLRLHLQLMLEVYLQILECLKYYLDQSIVKLNDYEVNKMINLLQDVTVEISHKDQVIDLIDMIDNNNEDSISETIIIKSTTTTASTTTTTTNQLSDTICNDSSNNKLKYQEFLPDFNSKLKILEEIKSSQLHSCQSLLELINNRITLLYEYTMKNK